MLPCQENNKSFFTHLQNASGLDLRDNRGKRHPLAVVLVGVTLAVLSHRDGNLSSIHRHLSHHYEKLVVALGVEKERPVSRSQLPIILEKVSVEVFDQLLFTHFGIKLNAQQRQWFALDGKELCGSIEIGEKRGEALVQAIAHETGDSAGQNYYSGTKESEVPAVRQLLAHSGLESEKVSFDALHCKPDTLKQIVEAKGRYLVGVKDNQKELKKLLSEVSQKLAPLWRISTIEKGHGRIESRSYEFYDILELEKDERWENCQLRTLIKVTRYTEHIKSGKNSHEESYYVTNEVGNYEELGQAIRNHWRVETANHVRDVSLREDQMRSKKRISIG